MQKSIQTLIEETKEDLGNIIDSKIELYKLTAYEKGVPVGLNIAYNTVLIVLLLFVVGLLLISGALGLSTLFVGEVDSTVLTAVALGFLAVGGMLLLVGLIMLLLRKSIVRSTYNKIIGKMLDETPEVINADTLAIESHLESYNTYTQEERRR